ncbi:hypothetical protein ACTWPB_17560 [Nocardia sp. IBHARD005]|uniref:hypothetical protein n=1 Tax=Nocardia sp. IBHARD005 TaxID=3457765 RepID=UPI00405926BC
MELHELEIGHRRPGPQCQRHTVAGRPWRIGAQRIELPEPAGGQQHGGRVHDTEPVVRHRDNALHAVGAGHHP